MFSCFSASTEPNSCHCHLWSNLVTFQQLEWCWALIDGLNIFVRNDMQIIPRDNVSSSYSESNKGPKNEFLYKSNIKRWWKWIALQLCLGWQFLWVKADYFYDSSWRLSDLSDEVKTSRRILYKDYIIHMKSFLLELKKKFIFHQRKFRYFMSVVLFWFF